MVKEYLWVDTETSGLFTYGPGVWGYWERIPPVVLEIAAIRTDKNFNELGTPLVEVIKPPANFIDRMNNYVRDMHLTNDLIKEVVAKWDDLKTPEQVDREISYWIGNNKPILAGSSVHFDRAVIESYFPDTNECLHYRNLDVSSFKEFVKDQFPDVSSRWQMQVSDDKAHRALEDIRTSIAEMKFYATALGATLGD